jgi:hypothetical protein
MAAKMISSGEALNLDVMDNLVAKDLGLGKHALYATTHSDKAGNSAVKYTVIHKPGLHLGSGSADESDIYRRKELLVRLAHDFCDGLKSGSLGCSYAYKGPLDRCLIEKTRAGSDFEESSDISLRSFDLSNKITSTQRIPEAWELEVFYGACNKRVKRI